MSANKSKGTRFESAVCAYLNGVLGYSHPTDWRMVKRVVQTGARDQGDVHAWPLVLECKDVKSPAVPTWLRQAEVEAVNAGFPYSVVCHKVRGKGPALARVHISAETFRRLREDLDVVALSPELDPVPAPHRPYWTWTLAEFAQVLAAVRAARPPVND